MNKIEKILQRIHCNGNAVICQVFGTRKNIFLPCFFCQFDCFPVMQIFDNKGPSAFNADGPVNQIHHFYESKLN